MDNHTSRKRVRLRMPALVLVACATVLMASPSSDSHAGTTPTYRIDFHRISAGGGSSRNACYRLDGSVGQPAPGYSSGPTFTVVAGFMPAAIVDRPDSLFFSGFEGC
jgi:hypothetical protein